MKVRMKRTGSSAAATGRVNRHRVRDALREMILSGKYPPGSRLPQMQLAKEFGVAQGVIRESFLELKAFGLVETVDNLGVFVANLDADRIIQAYEIREMLEGLAGRLACRRASREDLAGLMAVADRICALAEDGKREEMGALDRDFHLRLIQISRNEMLEQLTESYRVLGKVLRVDRDAQTVRDEHMGVLKAIEEDRPDDAESLMRRHIRAAKEIIERQVTDGTFVPKWVGG
ncbi:MAG: GntR family transcriptional regulator [Phycisphaerae bacterium]|nr:GntR family transcriptional regulator [Phycisphaerae bacterium]